MFEQALIDRAVPGTRARNALLGFVTQATLLTAAVLIPIVFPETLPRVQLAVGIFAPSPPPPPAPVRMQLVDTGRVVRDWQVRNGVITLPVNIPSQVALIDDPPGAVGDTSGSDGPGVPGGTGTGAGFGDSLLKSISSLVPTVRPAPPPPPTLAPVKAPEAKADPLRVSRGVQEAMILRKVIPLYPPLARSARISGVVQIIGHIGTDGHIRELQVTSGHPLLVTAAVDAVRQWVYRPTLLNGEPVEVIAPITVTFTLN